MGDDRVGIGPMEVSVRFKDGTTVGTAVALLHRFAFDDDDQVLHDYGEWTGYLEFDPSPGERTLRRMISGETLLVTYGLAHARPIRVSFVFGDLGGGPRFRCLVEESLADDEGQSDRPLG